MVPLNVAFRLFVLVTMILCGSIVPVDAQQSGPYQVGDAVEVYHADTGEWKRAVIKEVYSTGYLVMIYSGPNVSGAVEPAPASRLRPWHEPSATRNVPATVPQGGNAAPAAAPNTGSSNASTTVQPTTAQFKVGDRVMSSSIVAGNAPYRPCTVMSLPTHGTYGLRCDPWRGRPYQDMPQFPGYLRAAPSGSRAPKLAACSFDVPHGTVSRSAPASPQLFQRVIYERLALIQRGKMGLAFTTFRMAAPYKNAVIHNAMGGAEKQFPNVPLGATVYPIRSQYVTCFDTQTGFDERTVVDADYACMKDSFGDWSCPVDSVPKIVKVEKIPR